VFHLNFSQLYQTFLRGGPRVFFAKEFFSLCLPLELDQDLFRAPEDLVWYALVTIPVHQVVRHSRNLVSLTLLLLLSLLFLLLFDLDINHASLTRLDDFLHVENVSWSGLSIHLFQVAFLLGGSQTVGRIPFLLFQDVVAFLFGGLSVVVSTKPL